MASRYQQLHKAGLLPGAPRGLESNVQYEVITGSEAYGVSQNTSDIDIVGFAIPPKDVLFPHLGGYIAGFDEPTNVFNQYQQHHIQDKSARGGKGAEYDIVIYNIVKFFKLCMENNPNMVDTLFVPRNCVLHSTHVGNLVRENRKLFLHKGAYHKFKGYAYSQLHKMRGKSIVKLVAFEKHHGILEAESDMLIDIIRDNPKAIEDLMGKCSLDMVEKAKYIQLVKACGQISKRKESVRANGYDVKFAYHVVRLLGECEQILTTGDLDLQRDKEVLKSIRRGEWSIDKVTNYFDLKEKLLEDVYKKSTLRYSPDTVAIKNLLMHCLEQHYGDLSTAVVQLGTSDKALQEILAVMTKYNVGE